MPTPRKEFKMVLDNGVYMWLTDASNDLPTIVQPQSITVNGDVFRNGEFVKVTEEDGEVRHMFIIEIGVKGEVT